MKANRFIGLMCAGLLASALAQPALANRYRIVDLGLQQIGTGMNNSGSVSGYDNSGPPLVYRNGRWHELPEEGTGAYTTGINDLGQVSGTEYNGSDSRAVVWQPDKSKLVLPTPNGGWRGQGLAISSTGFVAGNYEARPSGQTRCFRWTPAGRSKDLGTLGQEEVIATHKT